jgi:hypothetical protein
MAFKNYIRNLTIDVGKGNLGACAIRTYVSNQGAVTEVTLRGNHSGFAGIWIVDSSGPGLVKNVNVIGFDYGIYTRPWDMSMTYEDIHLEGQRKAAIMNAVASILFMRNVHSRNSVPVYSCPHRRRHGPALLMVNGTFEGGDPKKAAIVNGPGGGKGEARGGSIFLRNIKSEGYGKLVDVAGDKHDHPGPTIEEYNYQRHYNRPVVRTIGESAAKSLNLPVRETPTYNTNDVSKWVAVEGIDGKGIQEAIDKCPPGGVVYFGKDPRLGEYHVRDTIVVRGNVRKLMSLRFAGIKWAKDVRKANAAKPLFRVETMNHDEPVIFEHFECINGRVEQNSRNDLALMYTHLKNAEGFHGETSVHNVYNGPRGTGTIFLQDTMAEPTVNKGGTMHCRQLNIEFSKDPGVENKGGFLWILGIKTEVGRPQASIMHNLPGARTEILGFYNKPLNSQGDHAVIINEENVRFSAAMMDMHPGAGLFLKVKRGGEWVDYRQKGWPDRKVTLLVSDGRASDTVP